MIDAPPAGSFLEGDHTEFCEFCEDYAEVEKTIVTAAPDHDVITFKLDCGHDRDTDHVSFSESLVEDLQDQRPEDIEVRDAAVAE